MEKCSVVPLDGRSRDEFIGNMIQGNKILKIVLIWNDVVVCGSYWEKNIYEKKGANVGVEQSGTTTFAI